MSDAASDQTQVIATYATRAYAEMAQSYLADQGIDAFVTADDVHVPLQLTEGARLRVMASRAEAARFALYDAEMLPEHFAVDDEPNEA